MLNRENATKKKNIKKKLLVAAKGSISIMLCLLITPFITVAGCLIEYSRYQEVLELTDEIYELTGVSVLADYDGYIHNRFGLLATTQENDFSQNSVTTLEQNIKILGAQVALGNVKIEGGELSLANDAVLEQQLLDIGEITTTTAVLLEDLDLQSLFDALNNMQAFTEFKNGVKDMSDLTKAIKDAVDALKSLNTTANSLKSTIETATRTATSLPGQVQSLFQTLFNNGIYIPQNATLEEIKQAIDSVTENETLKSQFKTVFNSVKSLKSSFDKIKNDIGTLKTQAEKVKTSVEAASKLAKKIGQGSSNSKAQDAVKDSAKTLEDALEDMETLVTDCLNDITDTTVKTVRDSIDEILDETMKVAFGEDFLQRADAIAKGTYFSDVDITTFGIQLSDFAKQDLEDLLRIVANYVKTDENGNHYLDTNALTTLAKKFVPNFGDFKIASVAQIIKSCYDNAKATIEEKVSESVSNTFTDLLNSVRDIFKLDVFYNGDFNAIVNLNNDSSSGYDKFLNALSDLLDNAETLFDPDSKADFFERLEALGSILENAWNMLEALWEIVEQMISSIGEILSGNASVYDKLVLSGYMRHCLPSRIDGGNLETTGDFENRVALNGMSLTGFAFNDIARPSVYYGGEENPLFKGFSGMSWFMKQMKGKNSTDEMFKGCELEYIRAGTKSEIANQIFTFFDIYFMRAILDIPSVFGSGEVNTLATGANIFAPIVFILYILGEPFCDAVLLVNGAKVPMLRESCWLTVTGLPKFTKLLADCASNNKTIKEKIEGLGSFTSDIGGASDTWRDGLLPCDYETHLMLIICFFSEKKDIIDNFRDIVELETKYYYKHTLGKSFKISEAYTAVEITADVTFNPFIDFSGTFNPIYEIKRTISY